MIEVLNSNESYNYNRNKWYNSEKFPLIPVIKIRKPNGHNTSSFSFKWLFINMWTLDGIDIEIGITASTHWGIGFLFLLPFLRLAITIPCPNKLDWWISRNLHRKPSALK